MTDQQTSAHHFCPHAHLPELAIGSLQSATRRAAELLATAELVDELHRRCGPDVATVYISAEPGSQADEYVPVGDVTAEADDGAVLFTDIPAASLRHLPRTICSRTSYVWRVSDRAFDLDLHRDWRRDAITALGDVTASVLAGAFAADLLETAAEIRRAVDERP